MTLATATHLSTAAPAVARINGVALHTPGEALSAEALRQRACTELLRQAAQAAGILDQADRQTPDGVVSEAAAQAIEALLEDRLQSPEPSDDECRRHHAAQASTYQSGEQIRLRHILFAVTPGVDVVALRQRAEATLLEVRSHADQEVDRFAEAARTLSNCPSGAESGDLGWLLAVDCAPEFARQVFGHAEVGVLPRLVHTRFGLHVVEVLERKPGVAQSFASVRAAVALSLRQQTYVNALRQYLQVLAGAAVLEGVDLDAAATPLVQ